MPLIRGDAVQLERALANLLENAARYSAPEPVLVRVRRMGDRVMIRVVDRGPGLAYGEHERVFEPFYRGPSAGAGNTGSGLGLAIVRGFVEANGGRVWAESLPGQGTTFVVELPVQPVADARSRRSRRDRRAAGPDLRRRARRSSARSRSCCARRASTPSPPPTSRRRSTPPRCRPPDAAIIDLMLPDGDGVEIVRALREWSEMPIIVLSALGEEDEKVRALEAGADDYVTKPFGARELVARLNASLRRSARQHGRADDRRRRPRGRPRRATRCGATARAST